MDDLYAAKESPADWKLESKGLFVMTITQKVYYRVAIRLNSSPTWQWKSTVLSSLHALPQFLQLYRAFPYNRLRVFSSSSRQDTNEQLVRENNGLGSSSVTAEHFLRERRISPPEMGREAPEHGECKTVEEQEITFRAVSPNFPLNESGEEAGVLSEKSDMSKNSNVEQGAIMTIHTPSPYPPPTHKFSPGSSSW